VHIGIPGWKEVTTMKYAAPELVVLGTAAALVQGSSIEGKLDNGDSETSRPAAGIALGLDD
jgi:hypothetical protein